MPLRRLRTHVDAHRASGCPWQNQPTKFKKKKKKLVCKTLIQNNKANNNGKH